MGFALIWRWGVVLEEIAGVVAEGFRMVFAETVGGGLVDAVDVRLVGEERVEVKVGPGAGNGAGGAGRGKVRFERGAGSREGDAGAGVEPGVGARSGGGAVGRGRVSRVGR